jgi:hypothetical protein
MRERLRRRPRPRPAFEIAPLRIRQNHLHCLTPTSTLVHAPDGRTLAQMDSNFDANHGDPTLERVDSYLARGVGHFLTYPWIDRGSLGAQARAGHAS